MLTNRRRTAPKIQLKTNLIFAPLQPFNITSPQHFSYEINLPNFAIPQSFYNASRRPRRAIQTATHFDFLAVFRLSPPFPYTLLMGRQKTPLKQGKRGLWRGREKLSGGWIQN